MSLFHPQHFPLRHTLLEAFTILITHSTLPLAFLHPHQLFTMSWILSLYPAGPYMYARWPVKGFPTTVHCGGPCSVLLRGLHPSHSLLHVGGIILMLVQWRCRLLHNKFKYAEDTFVLLCHLHIPSRCSHCIPGNMWNTVWKYLGKIMSHHSSVWVQNCSSTASMDKRLLWFLCTKEHRNAGFVCLFADCTLCVPVGQPKAMGPRLICWSMLLCCWLSNSTISMPSWRTTANILTTAQVQRGWTDFQVWNKLESCVLVWSLQWYQTKKKQQQKSMLCLES